MAWRAKQYSLHLGRHYFITIKFRRFKTSKNSRSVVFKQLVVPIRGGRLKEVAFSLKHYKRPLKRSPTNAFQRILLKNSSMILLPFGILGLVFFGLQVFGSHSVEPTKVFAVPASQVIKATKSAQVIKALPASLPTNISIPAVNINAPVMQVGQAEDGTIQMPPILDWTTGWYKYSPTPGQIGPSVIVGHVDNYKSIWVFWRLRYLLPGDDIYISRADGTIAHFKVVALKQFPQSNFPTQEVYGNIDYPGLRLVTCGGTFSHTTESYNQNTVVFADMVNN